jgi:hypothetical protein
MKKFPKQIYVTRENEGTGDECLLTYIEPSDAACISEDVPCAIYQLVGTGKVVASATYVPNPKKRG